MHLNFFHEEGHFLFEAALCQLCDMIRDMIYIMLYYLSGTFMSDLILIPMKLLGVKYN